MIRYLVNNLYINIVRYLGTCIIIIRYSASNLYISMIRYLVSNLHITIKDI